MGVSNRRKQIKANKIIDGGCIKRKFIEKDSKSKKRRTDTDPKKQNAMT